MNEIFLDQDGRPYLREKTPLGEEKIFPLLEAQQVAKRLRRSLRQIYRYIREKRLNPISQCLGRWVFKERDIERFALPRRGRGARLPTYVEPFFWSYPKTRIDPSGKAEFVAAQIAQEGDLRSIRWALRRYGPAFIKQAVSETKETDAKTKNFWQLIA